MKTKFFLHVFTVFVVACLLVGCEKKDKAESKSSGSLYGTVIDKTTGTSIANANVELVPLGLSTVTGTDGSFEFANVEEGTYNLYVKKSGYMDYKTPDVKVSYNSSEQFKCDVQLEKLPPALQVLDETGKSVQDINFGYTPDDVVRTINIFNNGENKLTWQITSSVKWISKIKPEEGELQAGATQSVVIMIDRTFLAEGVNETTLHITSNNGSKQINVSADGYEAPEVHIYNATNIACRKVSLIGGIVKTGIPSFDKFGFVINTSAHPDLNNTVAKISIPTKEIPDIKEKITYDVTNLMAATKYYVRAYAINVKDTAYSNEIEFKTLNPSAPQLKLITPGDVTAFSAIFESEITNDGGSDITAKGVCWSQQQSASIDGNHTNEGAGTEKFVSIIKDLQANTTYYLRAYAINAAGVGYSSMYTIKTNDVLPVVSTQSGYVTGTYSLCISGSVKSTEGAPIIRQGICYNNSGNPTVNDNIVLTDNGKSSFTCTMVNLKSATTYYCRAFAENEYGVAYGQTIMAHTDFEPATVEGYVYDQDGSPIIGASVTYSDGYNSHDTYTDNSGHYILTSIKIKRQESYYFTIKADNYETKNEYVNIKPGVSNTKNFILTVSHPFAVDLGRGVFINTGSAMTMVFSCSQSSLMGKTTTKIMRIKNYRSTELDWYFSGLPSTGISVSKSYGTIPARGEVSIVVSFTYPSTTSQLVTVRNCTAGSKSYVWNWQFVAGNNTLNEFGDTQSVDCCACCGQDANLTVGDYTEGFSILFNQYVVLR